MPSVKKITSYSKKFYYFFESFQIFRTRKSSYLSRKKYDGNNSTFTHHNRLVGQNALVGIRFIKVTETSDTLNYMQFFKCCMLQTISQVILHFVFVQNKSLYYKNGAVFCLFLFRLGWFLVLQCVIKILCFWCYYYKVIGNQGFIGYNRYKLLRIGTKANL